MPGRLSHTFAGQMGEEPSLLAAHAPAALVPPIRLGIVRVVPLLGACLALANTWSDATWVLGSSPAFPLIGVNISALGAVGPHRVGTGGGIPKM